MRQQRRLDLSELDAKAAHLHLEVGATQKLYGPIRCPAPLISGAIHPRSANPRIRIGHEALLRQLWPFQVPVRYSGAANVNLPGHPDGGQAPLRVQDVYPCVGDRTAYGNAACPVRDSLDPVPRGERRTLGRAIDVHQSPGRAATHELSDGTRIAQLSAVQQISQIGERLGNLSQVLVEECGRQEQGADALVPEQLRKTPYIECVVRSHDHDTGSIQQRAPHFERAGIEGGVGRERDPIAGIDLHVVGVDDQTANGPVRHHDTLGLAGGPGGVHHIGSRFPTDRHTRIAQRPGTFARPREYFWRRDRPQPWLLPIRRGSIEQHAPGLAVLGDESQPLFRPLRVQRHVRRSALADSQLADDQLDRSLQQERHAIAHLHTFLLQMARESVRLVVQLRIAQLPFIVHNRDRIRCAPHPLLEELMDAPFVRISPMRRVPAHQLPMTLLLGGQLVARHPRLAVSDDLAQQPPVMTE